MNEIFNILVEDYLGNDYSLRSNKGRVILIVNTASECGFTPQYEGLEELYRKYNDKGLDILAFPCNQFGNQEKGSNEEIQSFCKLKYGVSFPVFGKIDVNGNEESILYTLLKSEKKGIFGDNIKWNFTKFLVDKQGVIVKRFAPNIKPAKLEKHIEKLL